MHPAPQDARSEIALQHRILEQALPAAVKRSLVACLSGWAQAGELGGEIRREPLDLRAQRERLVIGSVCGAEHHPKQQDNDSAHDVKLRVTR